MRSTTITKSFLYLCEKGSEERGSSCGKNGFLLHQDNTWAHRALDEAVFSPKTRHSTRPSCLSDLAPHTPYRFKAHTDERMETRKFPNNLVNFKCGGFVAVIFPVHKQYVFVIVQLCKWKRKKKTYYCGIAQVCWHRSTSTSSSSW